ncbi:mRNA decay activator protein ZFP36L1, partial [Trichonephila clavata]
SPTHKGNFLQGGKSAVSNINLQNANHRRNSCSPPLSKNICSQQQQQHEVPAKSNANESRKLERSCSETGTDRRVVQSNSSRYKTELCRPFEENGSCKYGDKCQFAHGKKELRNMVRHPSTKPNFVARSTQLASVLMVQDATSSTTASRIRRHC